jgi:hypothetical protein
MKKRSLSLDKEIVLQQEEIDGGAFSALVTDCVVAIAIGISCAIISDHIDHPSQAFSCDCPTDTCVSCNGTCHYSCNGSCDCFSFGMCPA